jgi:hypothetical protein
MRVTGSRERSGHVRNQKESPLEAGGEIATARNYEKQPLKGPSQQIRLPESGMVH